MKNKVVVFTENNARILKGLSDAEIAAYKEWPNAIINPDLSATKGLPPHFWKLSKDKRGGKIVVAQNPVERRTTSIAHLKTGVDVSLVAVKPRFRLPKWLLEGFAWAGLGAALLEGAHRMGIL